MADTSDSDDPRAGDISAWRAINTSKPTRDTIVVEDEGQNSGVEQDITRVESSPFQDDVRVQVEPPQDFDPAEFEDLTHLAEVVAEVRSQSAGLYNVAFEDGHVDKLTLNILRSLEGGKEALEAFHRNETRSDDDENFSPMSSTRPSSKRTRGNGFIDTANALAFLDGSDESDEQLASSTKRRSAPRSRRSLRARTKQSGFNDSGDDSEDGPATRPSRRARPRDNKPASIRLRSRREPTPDVDEDNDLQSDESEEDELVLRSDVAHRAQKRKRPMPQYLEVNPDDDDDVLISDQPSRAAGTRQSGRSTRHQGAMGEVGINDIYRSDSDPRPVAPPKAIGAKEVFKDLPRTDPFRIRHVQQCDTCGNGANYAPLIYCQGCILAYHKNCLGTRNNREHLVTKIGYGDFVLQCRRCIAFPRKKEPTAPDQSKCQDCKQTRQGCRPFRSRKTPAQEQKEREDNGGDDPIYSIPPQLINNASNVLFRCTNCFRGFHFEDLPPRSDVMEMDSDSIANQRFAEYARDWKCEDCATMTAKVAGLVAWKPVDEDNYDPSKSIDQIDEDEKAYLVRWENKSYFRATWMPGPWVWGVTAGSMRKAFARRDEARVPKMRTEDAIPEEFLRTDIVLDVKYTSYVDIQGEEIDKARIREVSEALIKFKGLGYEDAVWEKPPVPEDEDRWTDFVVAYNDWVLGKYIHIPKALPLKNRLERARSMHFATKLEKKKQPDNLVGGELMKYQLEGVNWLYYKWFCQENAVLADEMGLGKTIQIIGFLATLVQEWNCFPFLVVVPNSTCPNWRREIKQWAPSLRVVAYYGSKESRDMAYRYELYPKGSKDLRCHVVVTSYDAAQDENCRRFFRSVPWQAMIVDEGQRLKNDKNLLYSALSALKVPFRILLTGTPLQNNARELFNLLQFLDENFDAAQLETEYENLTAENVPRLHGLIRPFFLRRTKAQVLTFLPPMAQIILPVSMSLVQKKLYRSILAKNPDLLKAIFTEKRDLKSSERASLSNILMQLRKCLCHPFVYSQSIEERNVSQAVSHRNLVEASGKLQLLEMLLPKLRERGHRVLIFSQFLDMLNMVEDFLDGLGFQYQRLDGTIGTLQKQKRIDEFNAPGSELFAFLLSTRAGGVGINLATADTVIIMDPDFNPHQDIQALSRAHRIGQKNKVLCFHLVTRASAEEKMMQVGRKKMALDHVLIENMDAEDAEEKDLESILKYGASEIFDDDGEKDVKYDEAQIDKLLDRSHIENTQAGDDKTAETQFSFARVWANNELEDTMQLAEAEDAAPDPSVWDKILRERERAAAAEAAKAEQTLGRGRRAKINVVYAPTVETQEAAANDGEDGSQTSKLFRKIREDRESDTDFQATSDGDDAVDEPDANEVDLNELDKVARKKSSKCSLVLKLRIKQTKTISKILSKPSKALVASSKRKRPAMKSIKEAKVTPKKTFKQASAPIMKNAPNNTSRKPKQPVKAPAVKSLKDTAKVKEASATSAAPSQKAVIIDITMFDVNLAEEATSNATMQ
ncbi:hypothetical protein MBLNU457_4080t2 [Dothideomycetes sp. NU457]